MTGRSSRLALAVGLVAASALQGCGSTTSSHSTYDMQVVYVAPPKGCSELGFLTAPTLELAASWARKKGGNLLYVERDVPTPDRERHSDHLVRVYGCDDPDAVPQSLTYHFRGR